MVSATSYPFLEIFWTMLIFFTWVVGRGLVALIRTLSQPWPADVRLIPAAIVSSTLRMIIAYAISLAWTVPVALAASENHDRGACWRGGVDDEGCQDGRVIR